jgi:hypothetical protein
MRYRASFAMTPTTGHCEERLPASRQVVTKPCPEQIEGTLEIATGFALATTI